MVAANDIQFSKQDRRSLNDRIGDMRSDFRASQDSRFMARLQGVNPTGSGADFHYRSERAFLHMMERARYYERDEPVIGQGLSRLSANVIQEGFTPDPSTGSSDLNARLKDLWSEWAEEPDFCHSEGEHNFHDMEELVFRSAIRDGDLFPLPLKSGSLQLVEGHRPRTPRRTRRNVVHGILLDKMAKRQELWVSKEELGFHSSVDRVSDLQRYSFRDSDGYRQVFQVYFPKRTSQRRGYTAFAPVSDTIGMHGDLQFTKLVQHQMASLIVLIRQRLQGEIAGTGNGSRQGLGNGTATEEVLKNNGIRKIPGIDAGLDVTARPGEKIEFNSSNIPNESFFSHANLLLTFIAINLDMPVAMLLLDASNTNFSGWRGTVDQARVRFRWFQRKLISQFHRRVYTWKVRQWLALDPMVQEFAAQSGVTPLRHKWKVPGWPYIEPFKDSQSDNLQQERFLNSPRRIQGARGRDWEEIAPEIVEDKGMLIELAIEKANAINQKYADAGVTWREILGPGLNSTVQMVPESPETAGATRNE
ncbi:MAG: phage portal protein [Planctomycetota bacterium]